MKKFFIRVLILLLITASFFNIQRQHNLTHKPAGHFWALESLRGFDPINTTFSPDIIAYYAREIPYGLQLRIDFLNLKDFESRVLFIENTASSSKPIQLYPQLDNPNVYLFINWQQNYITLHLPHHEKRHEFRFYLKNQQGEIIDSTAKFSLYSQQPDPIQANLSVTSTQLGHTPAQILRNWDGAHNGPFGERFGLSHLLTAGQKYKIPIILNDFLTPANLNALNLLEQTEFIHKLRTIGLLRLDSPVFIKEPIYAKYIADFKPALLNSNFPPPISCVNQPIPTRTIYPEFTGGGLSPKTLTTLINAHFSNPRQHITFSIPFNDAPIGDFNAASLIFDFLKNHPWIQFSLPGCPLVPATPQLYPTETIQTIANDLNQSTGPFQTNALFHFYALLEPKTFESVQPLIPIYLPELYYAVEANRWANSPDKLINCDIDVDKDQENECILQHQNYFMIYELNGSYIPFFAVKDSTHQFFQVTGSSSQLMFGLSPSQEWDLTKQVFSDPSVIPGIMAQPAAKKQVVSISPDQNQLLLSAGDQPYNLRITLAKEELTLEYEYYCLSDTQTSLQIPFICPNSQNGSSYVINQDSGSPQTLLVSCDEHSLSVQISGEILDLQHASPTDLHTLLQSPENPNFEYPRAHYLPLGLSVFEITFDTQLKLTFKIP